jgi:membrane fusion protein (multidrug efflux system)
VGDARFEGKIRLINPVVNPQTGTIKVTVTLDNVEAKPSRLRPGMFVSVFLITDKRKGATLIPKRGVVYKDDKSFVFVAQGEGQDRVAERRPIEVGFSEEENVEVIAGLETGDEIVVLGQSGLKDGAEIRIVK